MFGRNRTSHSQQDQRNVSYGQPSTSGTAVRPSESERRQMRSQIDLLREVRLASPWYF